MGPVSAGEKCEIERSERRDIQRQDKSDFPAQGSLLQITFPSPAPAKLVLPYRR